MEHRSRVSFPPFEVDTANERLYREGEIIPLRPKVFAILCYLVEHSGRLVSREELTKAVWPNTVVSESSLRVCIRELRDTLEDNSEEPRFIETVARRGYRWVATIAASVHSATFTVHGSAALPAAVSISEVPLHSQPETLHCKPETLLVGRETELTRLEDLWSKAQNGQRQVVFITGEPGIGKTTLVDAFLAKNIASRPLTPGPRIGWGQCVEQYGAGEAYLPVLEALGRLCRGVEGPTVIAVLRQHAPTWLVQMSAFLTESEFELIQRRAHGATRERMLREFAEGVEVLTADTPLVIVLEDLHWSDHATIDLLSMVARRSEPARLLILGTYRPADVALSGHPLKAARQELQTHQQCEEVVLPFLKDAAVAQYLDARFPTHHFPPNLSSLLCQRTDGNPLFVVNTVDTLVQQKTISEKDGQWQLVVPLQEVTVGAPDNVRQLIEKQIARLTEEERHLLEIASVAGVEFSAAVLAAGGLEIHVGETMCERLMRKGQFLQDRGIAEWPDGTVATRYGFLHTLYQNVLYEQIPSGRRVRLHSQMGALLEKAYGNQVFEIAAALAVHFATGRDSARAVQYHEHAAQIALRRNAVHEAIVHIQDALRLLAHQPDSQERIQRELSLQITLGSAVIAAKGLGAEDVEQAFSRARVLSQQVEDSALSIPVLIGLGIFFLSRSEFTIATALAEQSLRLAEAAQNQAAQLTAHLYLGANCHEIGDFRTARGHYEQTLHRYDPQHHRHLAFVSGQDPGISAGAMLSWALCTLGYCDQARSRMDWTLAQARELSHANTLALVLVIDAFSQVLLGDLRTVMARAEEATTFSLAQGIPSCAGHGRVIRGWALTRQGQWDEGIASIHIGIAEYAATGTRVNSSWDLLLLADACRDAGHFAEGLTALHEAFAFVEQTGERICEAELWRLKGELIQQQESTEHGARSKKSQESEACNQEQDSKNLHPQSQLSNPTSEAEACFLKAIAIAQQQEAKLWELRAVMSLVRLRQRQALEQQAGSTEKKAQSLQRKVRTAQDATQSSLAEARRMFFDVYHRFTEGFDTTDMQEATALLASFERSTKS